MTSFGEDKRCGGLVFCPNCRCFMKRIKSFIKKCE